MTKDSLKFTAQLKLFAAIAIWGGSFIATKIAVSEVSPVTVVWLRFFIGTLILGLYAWHRNELRIPSVKDGLEFLLLGFLGITLHQWLQSSGLVTSEASTTSWIVSTSPVFMVILAWLFLKEKMNPSIILGIVVATFGTLLVVSKGDVEGLITRGFSNRGDVLILISAINWAVYSILSRPTLQRHSSIKITFYVSFFGWLLTCVQFFAGAYWSECNQLSASGWVSIVFLGIFCSAISYIFYNDGLQVLPASQVGAFLYLEPLVTTLVAAFLLREQIVLATLTGGAFILLGLWFVNRRDALLPE